MKTIICLIILLTCSSFVRSQSVADTVEHSRLTIDGGIALGICRAVETDGDFLYAGVGGHFVVYDAGSSDELVEIGKTLIFDTFINQIRIVGDVAFVESRQDLSGYRSTLLSINIENPAEPTIMDTLYLGRLQSFSQSMVYHKGYIYQNGRNVGLYVIDAEDPSDLRLISNYTPADNIFDVYDIAISGDTAYAAFKDYGVVALDIAKPTAIHMLYRWANPPKLGLLTLVNRILYVLSHEDYFQNSLHFIDTGNPDTGVVSTDLFFGPVTRFLSDGSTGIIASTDGIYLLDFTSPENITTNDFHRVPGNSAYRDLAINDEQIYGALVDAIEIVDRKNDATVAPVALRQTYEWANTPTIDPKFPDRLYMSIRTRLEVHDISTPQVSDLIYQTELVKPNPGFRNSELTIHQGYLYVSKEGKPLEIFDLRNNPWPTQIGTTSFAPKGRFVFYKNHMYSQDSENIYVTSLDIPNAPAIVNTLRTNDGYPWAVGVDADKLLFCESRGILSIYNLLDPVNPVKTGTLQLAEAQFAVAGNYVYSSDSGYQHINIHDISDPSAPYLVDQIGIKRPYLYSASGRYLFVSHSPSSISVFDISSPARPRLLGTQDTGIWTDEMLAANNKLVGQGHYAGIFVLEVDEPTGISNDTPTDLFTNFQLSPNYPNPFNPQTTIEFELAKAGIINLEVFNTLGQRVRVLKSGWETAGSHHIVWDGRDDAGHPVSSGSYFYKLKTEHGEETRRMVLVR